MQKPSSRSYKGPLDTWRPRLAIAAGATILVIAAVQGRPAAEPPATPGADRETSVAAPDAKSSAELRSAAAPESPGDATPDNDEMTEAPPEETPAEAVALVPVDLQALRARLPDNLYWQLGEPTEDPAILARRAEEERRENDLFGKVQSGAASAEEIDRYYEHRRQVSEDYIEFAATVLHEHGPELGDRDRGLFELSIKMHRSRLAQLPRQIEEAHANKAAQDRRRAEWRAAAR